MWHTNDHTCFILKSSQTTMESQIKDIRTHVSNNGETYPYTINTCYNSLYCNIIKV